MADKTPDSVTAHNLGSLKLTIATFVSENIDDNDQWVSGIKSAVGYWTQQISDGPTDLNITSYTAATGTFLFDSAANVTCKVYVVSFDY
jgi:hypothetical protein